MASVVNELEYQKVEVVRDGRIQWHPLFLCWDWGGGVARPLQTGVLVGFHPVPLALYLTLGVMTELNQH